VFDFNRRCDGCVVEASFKLHLSCICSI
jgi:hypothetical protein